MPEATEKSQMEYYAAKIAEYNLAEAIRRHRNADFAREMRVAHQHRRPELLRSLICRLTNWTALRMCMETRDGRAASAAPAGTYFGRR